MARRAPEQLCQLLSSLWGVGSSASATLKTCATLLTLEVPSPLDSAVCVSDRWCSRLYLVRLNCIGVSLQPGFCDSRRQGAVSPQVCSLGNHAALGRCTSRVGVWFAGWLGCVRPAARGIKCGTQIANCESFVHSSSLPPAVRCLMVWFQALSRYGTGRQQCAWQLLRKSPPTERRATCPRRRNERK